MTVPKVIPHPPRIRSAGSALEVRSGVVFLLDVDNTLLDNDRVKVELNDRISAIASADRFWELYEAVRRERGSVDLRETVARFERHLPDGPRRAAVRELVEAFPFEGYLYPRALDTVRALRSAGLTVVLTDGDPGYQLYKTARAGIAASVDGRVLVFDHKERHLAAVLARFPARRYVLVDDKADTLAAVKRRLGSRVTTVHVRQGHYGRAPIASDTLPDLTLDRIADLADVLLHPLRRLAS